MMSNICIRRFAAWIFAAAVTLPLAESFAAESAAEAAGKQPKSEQPLPPPPPPGKRDGEKAPRPMRGGRRGANEAMWAAFARLSDAERKEMLELQRSDPEKFREKMKAKAEEYRAAREKRNAELRALAEKIRTTTDAKERETLRNRLVAEVKTDFLNRLAEHRRRIEAMKRHAARLEKDLDQRTAEADKVVEKVVEAMIEGKLPPPPPPRGREGEARGKNGGKRPPQPPRDL